MGASIKDVHTPPWGRGVCQKRAIVGKGEGMHFVLTTYTFFKPFVTKVTLLNLLHSKNIWLIRSVFRSQKTKFTLLKINFWKMYFAFSYFEKKCRKNLVNSLFYAINKNCLLFQTNDLIHKKEKLLTRLTEAEVLQRNLDRRSQIVSAFLRYSWHNPDICNF